MNAHEHKHTPLPQAKHHHRHAEHDIHPHGHHSPAASQRAAQSVPGAKYTCPMHPEIVRDAPGDSPICDMSLVLIAGSGEADDRDLRELARQFRVGAVLCVLLAMAPMVGNRRKQWNQWLPDLGSNQGPAD